jgi:ACS family tartrate transporter-like MFS transporter
MSWRLLPLIGLAYLMAYMDRANVSFAAVQMNVDLGFSATVYGLGAGLFFAGYSLFEIPSNLVMLRFGPRRWIARIMATWGLISASMMFVETPVQFYVLRFLLGVAEAGFFPGVLFYLSQWFPAAWRGRAVSRFYVAVPLSTALMGLLAGWLLGLDGILGLEGWQWLFLVEGLPAVILAGVLLWLLPDLPAEVPWLNADEKNWIANTLRQDVVRSGVTHSGFVRVLVNPMVLGLGSIMALDFACATAVSFSAPLLLMDRTGWSVTEVGYLIAASGVTSSLLMLIICAHSDRHGSRYPHIGAMALVGALMCLVLWWSSILWQTLPAFFLYSAATLILGPLCLVLATEVLHPDSRAVGYAAINTIAQVGNFSGPILWGMALDSTGSYELALTVIPLVLGLAALITWRMSARVSPA